MTDKTRTDKRKKNIGETIVDHKSDVEKMKKPKGRVLEYQERKISRRTGSKTDK